MNWRSIVSPPRCYRELRRLAAAAMSGQSGKRTIQPTALVHELYFQLPGVRHFDWQNRAHFLNVAAKMMRNILDLRKMRKKGTLIPMYAPKVDEATRNVAKCDRALGAPAVVMKTP
jgi:hypothetical protein